MEIINPEIRDLQMKYESLSEKHADLMANVARLQGELSEVKRISATINTQTIWQLLGFAIVMASVMMGGIYYQTQALRNEFNPKLEALQKQMDIRFDAQQQQIIQLGKTMNDRFEDLKQEVRAGRK